MGLTSKEFETINNSTLVGEYCFSMLLLFLVDFNYLGESSSFVATLKPNKHPNEQTTSLKRHGVP